MLVSPPRNGRVSHSRQHVSQIRRETSKLWPRINPRFGHSPYFFVSFGSSEREPDSVSTVSIRLGPRPTIETSTIFRRFMYSVCEKWFSEGGERGRGMATIANWRGAGPVKELPRLRECGIINRDTHKRERESLVKKKKKLRGIIANYSKQSLSINGRKLTDYFGIFLLVFLSLNPLVKRSLLSYFSVTLKVISPFFTLSYFLFTLFQSI